MHRTKFTEAEWQTVLFTPFWAFGVVATADGKTDDKETAVLTKEIAEAMLYKDDFAREVLAAVQTGLPTLAPAYVADKRSPLVGLREAADILESKMPGGAADQFKLAILGICVNTARASGPMIGSKASSQEKTAIAVVASILRIPLPVG
jgi:hypothetical protein